MRLALGLAAFASITAMLLKSVGKGTRFPPYLQAMKVLFLRIKKGSPKAIAYLSFYHIVENPTSWMPVFIRTAPAFLHILVSRNEDCA